MSSEKPHRKTRIGHVVSDKMDKTVVVQTSKKVQHPVYKKFVTRRVKYKAHDPNNEYQVGDKVEIEETRPLSREKRWQVTRLIERIG
ncbi:MAG: 30S ribosomal protein S17 [Myxococcales bacterium]|nr:30S ribosomal protein S17 [Myxococcales bacterium]MCB9519912.1 30S ribosomal protein S17 [Myxococcales bacterium]MCB9533181.1 30S ribosomal protein S17 [Myxococcales bacterium]